MALSVHLMDPLAVRLELTSWRTNTASDGARKTAAGSGLQALEFVAAALQLLMQEDIGEVLTVMVISELVHRTTSRTCRKRLGKQEPSLCKGLF